MKRAFRLTCEDFLFNIDNTVEFNYGNLGSGWAVFALPAAARRVRNFRGVVVNTKDCHPDYFKSQEGMNLPILHGQPGTPGWKYAAEISSALAERARDPELSQYEVLHFEKDAFGCIEMLEYIRDNYDISKIKTATFMGRVSEICVISCMFAFKCFFPQVKVYYDTSCGTGISLEGHYAALSVMRACQVDILETRYVRCVTSPNRNEQDGSHLENEILTVSEEIKGYEIVGPDGTCFYDIRRAAWQDVVEKYYRTCSTRFLCSTEDVTDAYIRQLNEDYAACQSEALPSAEAAVEQFPV